MLIALAASFACHVVKVHDGDGPIWCANGIKVRVAGVQAPDYEDTTPCREHRAEYTCSDAEADRSRDITVSIVLHKTMTCQPVGKSYKRVVARCTLEDGRSLSCALIAHGAAVKWDRWWRKYHMGVCR